MDIMAQVLALLTGTKIFDGRTWRVYDQDGNELADPGGVLWRGVHGALLWNQSVLDAPTQYGGKKKRETALSLDSGEDLVALVEDKWEAIERANQRDREKVAALLGPTLLAKVMQRPSADLPVDAAPRVLPMPAAAPIASITTATADEMAAIRKARQAAEDAIVLSLLNA
jgi:hypothetical protein